MKTAVHVNIGAAEGTRLFRHPRDRARFMSALLRSFPPREILAYCLMTTHAHAVLVGSERAIGRRIGVAIRAYSRWFRRRYRARGPIYRGPAHLTPITTPEQLRRTIRYVHDNPLAPKLALVPHHYEWSSAAEFVGLSRARFANVALALELLGDSTAGVTPEEPIELAELEPSTAPVAEPRLILAATTRTFGVYLEAVHSWRRNPRFVNARVAFVHLGRLEGYTDRQLAVALRKTRERVRQLGLLAADSDAVRIARTLLRLPEVREQLRVASAAADAEQLRVASAAADAEQLRVASAAADAATPRRASDAAPPSELGVPCRIAKRPAAHAESTGRRLPNRQAGTL